MHDGNIRFYDPHGGCGKELQRSHRTQMVLGYG